MQRDPRDLSGAHDLSPPQMGRVTAPLALFMRDVGPDGTTRAPVINGAAVLQRDQYLGADDLISEIIGGCRQMVREELERFLSAMMGASEAAPTEPEEEPAPENVTKGVHLAACTGNANCVEFPGCHCDVAEESGPVEPVKLRIPRTGPRKV